MKSDQLRAFVSVVEQGSFRAAASHLFKTQPTISAAVKALEEQFGISLLSRDAYRPTLTSEGKSFYKEAKRLLTHVAELESLGHQLSKGASPSLSISLSAMCAIPPGLNTIKQFCDRHPDLQLNISTEHLSGILEKLHLDKADVAIGPHTGLDDRFEFVDIGKVSMITVATPDCIAACFLKANKSNTSGVIAQQVLRQIPHILVADTGSQSPIDNINILSGGRRWYVKDYQVKKALLLADMGWARIPLHMIEAELASGALIPLQVENFASCSEVPIYLIRLRQHPLSELASHFWDEMIASKDR
ncbi:MAG: LysR family transcriptional regulator [Oceanospirillales bacterium]|nr:LysR family transcriptional regulator [Oceanospirillales bacterium]MBR9888716.1 LysR family transcriptional regulator [Oceanospirillales bacterium]